VAEEVAAERMGTVLDRLEAVGDGFHQRVAAGYRELAEQGDWAVVDGSGTIDEVFARVRSAYEEHLG
jgi:thymidylate kinase